VTDLPRVCEIVNKRLAAAGAQITGILLARPVCFDKRSRQGRLVMRRISVGPNVQRPVIHGELLLTFIDEWAGTSSRLSDKRESASAMSNGLPCFTRRDKGAESKMT
jgi:hypothetical protein